MKKIVIITPSLGMGGMERALVNYANMFVRRGYDVTVLNLTFHENSIVADLDKKVHYYSNYVPVKHLLKAKFKDIICGNFRLRSFVKWAKKHSAKTLYKKFIREKYDVEIAFFGSIATKIISGSNNKKATQFAWIHSANIEGLINDIGGEKEFCKVYNSIENIICVSDVIKEKASLLLDAQKLLVLNNPHDTNKVRELAKERVDLQSKGLNLINVSRLDDKSKGFIRLLDVCKKLNDQGLVYDLWILGDGVDAQKIKQHANDLCLNNVHFLGQQSNPYKYVSAADVYVCSSYYEGFSMTMMEAIILSKPIVTTKVSGAAQMLEDGKYGMIVENSERGIFSGLQKILSDKVLFNHYVEMANKRKDYFDENIIIQQFESVAFKESV